MGTLPVALATESAPENGLTKNGDAPRKLEAPPKFNSRSKVGLRVREQRKPDRGGRYHKSSRTRDESQRIAGQAYSRAYNTPFKSSRLQGIPVGHTVPFHSSATPRPASGPGRIRTQAMIRTRQKASIVKSNHAADYISSIYPARLPA